MEPRSTMHQHINTLPHLIDASFPILDETARAVLGFELCTSLKRVSVTGCGDSHHAAAGAELAFRQIANISARAHSALTFSRYEASFLKPQGPNTDVVMAVSVSGGVARTIEALKLGQLAGATGVAFTGSAQSPLGQVAQNVFEVSIASPPEELPPAHVPGVRSYITSQLALYLAAIRIAEVRAAIMTAEADALRRELRDLAEIASATIAACQKPVQDIVSTWQKPAELVFVGAGPLLGSAMFSAAKMIEASGAPALAQETEEWGHIQFFVEQSNTPTILIDAGGFSTGRTAEIAQSARTIGRQVIAIVPATDTAIAQSAHIVLPVQGAVRECFAPLLYSIPGALLAAEYAARLGSVYYRAFSNGRDSIDYDITSSIQIDQLCC